MQAVAAYICLAFFSVIVRISLVSGFLGELYANELFSFYWRRYLSVCRLLIGLWLLFWYKTLVSVVHLRKL